MKRTRENSSPPDALPSDIVAMSIPSRVAALRTLMANHNIDAYIVPTDDAHMSEYVANCDARRAFITGFDGSAGTALITMDAAYCWTDARYFLQASKQLPSIYEMKRILEDPEIPDWIAANLKQDTKLFFDSTTLSIHQISAFKSAFASTIPSNAISIEPLPTNVPNLVDQVWGSARPSKPASNIFLHPVEYAGLSVQGKFETIRASMHKKDVTMLIVTALDDVAWLLNLRGSDVDFNPVFWAYVTLTTTSANIYVNSTRFGENVTEYLKENHVHVGSYDSLLSDLNDRAWEQNDKVWLDPNTCNYAILNCIEKTSKKVQVLRKPGPIALAKAKKCESELHGMRECHIRDGVALVKFLCWLENEVVVLGNQPTECDAADKLQDFRSMQDRFVSLSFDTISGIGGNGAIIHYKPERETCAKLNKDEVYLVDSGGQYRDGTTDVTRTMHFGAPTDWQKECFTRVLKGHIAIDTIVFPTGTSGLLLDSFARHALWNVGLDYGHGTGHGVGSFMNVHEGPHSISFKAQSHVVGLQAGFIVSNEPGYYEEGGFGIRIESLCLIKETAVKGSPKRDAKKYLTMEHVTICPIQKKMIATTLLTDDEKKWVDSYHVECFEKLSPLLKDDEQTLAWLKKNTEPISAHG